MTMLQHELCPCGSQKNYALCCEIIHKDVQNATTAEQLMRARYSAFVKSDIDFIYNTFHPRTRRFQNKKDIENWARECKWMQLEIMHSTANTVEFKAQYLDTNLMLCIHHEKSNFKQIQNIWYYTDGKITS